MILDAYRSCGWKHRGFDTGYGKVVNRWNWVRTFDGIKDEKTLLSSYKPRTRWSVNRREHQGYEYANSVRMSLARSWTSNGGPQDDAASRPATKTTIAGSRRHSEAEPVSCSPKIHAQ